MVYQHKLYEPITLCLLSIRRIAKIKVGNTYSRIYIPCYSILVISKNYSFKIRADSRLELIIYKIDIISLDL